MSGVLRALGLESDRSGHGRDFMDVWNVDVGEQGRFRRVRQRRQQPARGAPRALPGASGRSSSIARWYWARDLPRNVIRPRRRSAVHRHQLSHRARSQEKRALPTPPITRPTSVRVRERRPSLFDRQEGAQRRPQRSATNAAQAGRERRANPGTQLAVRVTCGARTHMVLPGSESRAQPIVRRPRRARRGGLPSIVARQLTAMSSPAEVRAYQQARAPASSGCHGEIGRGHPPEEAIPRPHARKARVSAVPRPLQRGVQLQEVERATEECGVLGGPQRCATHVREAQSSASQKSSSFPLRFCDPARLRAKFAPRCCDASTTMVANRERNECAMDAVASRDPLSATMTSKSPPNSCVASASSCVPIH